MKFLSVCLELFSTLCLIQRRKVTISLFHILKFSYTCYPYSILNLEYKSEEKKIRPNAYILGLFCLLLSFTILTKCNLENRVPVTSLGFLKHILSLPQYFRAVVKIFFFFTTRNCAR